MIVTCANCYKEFNKKVGLNSERHFCCFQCFREFFVYTKGWLKVFNDHHVVINKIRFTSKPDLARRIKSYEGQKVELSIIFDEPKK